MPEPIDPSLAQPGTEEAQIKPEAVVSSEGQGEAAAQNDVPANFVEITPILEQPSPNEETTDTENEDDLPTDEETEEPEWRPADKNHHYWRIKEALQKDINALKEAKDEVQAQIEALPDFTSKLFDDLNKRRLRLGDALNDKMKFADEQEKECGRPQSIMRKMK